VAAALHHSLEVLTPDDSGAKSYRTYVGEIIGGLHSVALCQGQPLSEAAIHAIRLDEPAGDGSRALHIQLRRNQPQTSEPQLQQMRCRPNGVLKFRDLRAGAIDLPIADVRHILLKAVYP
jgi:hypothetical protein